MFMSLDKTYTLASFFTFVTDRQWLKINIKIKIKMVAQLWLPIIQKHTDKYDVAYTALSTKHNIGPATHLHTQCVSSFAAVIIGYQRNLKRHLQICRVSYTWRGEQWRMEEEHGWERKEREGAGIRQEWVPKKWRWRCGRHGSRREPVSLPVMTSSKEGFPANKADCGVMKTLSWQELLQDGEM